MSPDQYRVIRVQHNLSADDLAKKLNEAARDNYYWVGMVPAGSDALAVMGLEGR
jgi:hypothetical protein